MFFGYFGDTKSFYRLLLKLDTWCLHKPLKWSKRCFDEANTFCFVLLRHSHQFNLRLTSTLRSSAAINMLNQILLMFLHYRGLHNHTGKPIFRKQYLWQDTMIKNMRPTKSLRFSQLLNMGDLDSFKSTADWQFSHPLHPSLFQSHTHIYKNTSSGAGCSAKSSLCLLDFLWSSLWWSISSFGVRSSRFGRRASGREFFRSKILHAQLPRGVSSIDIERRLRSSWDSTN